MRKHAKVSKGDEVRIIGLSGQHHGEISHQVGSGKVGRVVGVVRDALHGTFYKVDTGVGRPQEYARHEIQKIED